MIPILLLLGAASGLVMLGAVSLSRLVLERPGVESSAWGAAAAVVLLYSLLVNLNLWLPASMGWGAVMVLAVMISAVCWRKTGQLLTTQGAGAVGASALTSVALSFVWLRMFGTSYLWLLQGDGNDLLYFFGGAAWASGHPLFVPQSVVNDGLNLGTCEAGAVIVGRGCTVYRGGSYTLLALIDSVRFDATANQLRAGLGLVGPLLVAGIWPLVSRLEKVKIASGFALPRSLCAAVLATLIGISTGFVGAVANGNMGTAFGAAVLATMIGWACTECDHLGLKAVALGFAAGLATHLYGESIVYACFIAATGVIADAVRVRRVSWIFLGGAASLLCLLLVANVLLADLLSSLLAISGMVTAVKWRAWYLSANPWTWIGAPFAGIQMDGLQLVQSVDLFIGYVLTLGTAVLSLRHRRWVQALCLAFLTAALVIYLERAQYEYGEHKILQLLGPMWATLLVALLYQSLATPGTREWERGLSVVTFCFLVALSLHFLREAHQALVRRIPERSLSLAFDDAILDAVRPGDEVVIDQSGVMNMDRFIKQDYATMLSHLRDGRVLLSSRTDDSIPAHTQWSRTNTFHEASSPDWLIRIKSPSQDSVLNGELPAIASSTGEYDLVSLKGGLGVVLSASGWHACEPGHCWTSGTYELEAFVPAACTRRAGGSAELVIQQAFHAPPAAGLVAIAVNGGLAQEQPVASAGTLRVPLPAGWSRISVSPDWRVTSPAEIGSSRDPRKLFAAVTHADIHCASGVVPHAPP